MSNQNIEDIDIKLDSTKSFNQSTIQHQMASIGIKEIGEKDDNFMNITSIDG